MPGMSDFAVKTYRGIERINKVAITASAIAILLLDVIVFYDIFMRYLLNKPSLWATEISTYLLLLITFISAGYTLQVDGHVNCNLFIAGAKPRMARIFFLISSPFGIMFCVILGWQVCRLFGMAYKDGWVSSYSLAIPLQFPYILMPIGVFLLVVTYISKVILVLVNPGEKISSE